MAEDKGVMIEHDVPDEAPASSEPDESPEEYPVLSVQETHGQLTKCQMQSDAEEGMDLGVCPAAASTAQDGTARWEALVKKLRRLIADVVRSCRLRDPSKGRHTRRVERIEKRLRKFIETD